MLTENDRKYLNEIYARAYKKHFASATDYASLEPVVPLTWDEAKDIAAVENDRLYAVRRVEINESFDYKLGLVSQRMENNQQLYNDQIAKINDNAAKRGMLASSIVLHQLNKAAIRHSDRQAVAINQMEVLQARCELALAKYEAVTAEQIERTAKKLFNESRKLSLAVEKERSIQQSRSYKDLLSFTKLNLTMPINSQQHMDEEVYGAYLEWLFGQPPADALDYVTYEPLFAFNLSSTYYTKLLGEVTRRAS